jgi:hypothetical protein
MNFKVRSLLVMVLVSVAVLLAAMSIAQAANLLNNGGFNGAFVSQPGVNGTVPAGWTAVNLGGNPIWTDSNSFAGGEKTEGSNAAVIVSEHIEDYSWPYSDGWAFTSVLYQPVHNVISGTAYSFATAMLTFCGGTAWPSDCPANYYMGKSIGIDPTGGTSPTAATVIWSQENTFNHQWRDITVASRALSSTVTVFIKVRWPFTFHGAFGVYDGAYLAQAPSATLSASGPVSSGPITLTWSGVVPQDVNPDYGGIALGFDVQVLDPAVSGWHNILTGTQQTTTVFNGAIGRTYQFRVLPFLGFLPDNHRFDGLYTDPVTVTVGDFTPPSSSVTSLPPIQYTTGFSVAWSGTDDISPPGTLVYDIQVRDGLAGAWTPWLTTTALTTALFTGQPGHTYYFSSRAHDQANNCEAYPANPDAATSVALAISGTIANLRDQPVPFASVGLSPSALPAGPANLNGQYTLWVTASDTYALNAARSGFGVLPPIGNIAANSANVGGVDAVLPPLVDLITNGQFESGNLGSWTGSIAAAPTVTTTSHSGNFAAGLGGATGVESTLQQTFFLSPTLGTPTLSYLYRAPVSAGDLITVTVQGDSPDSVMNPTLPANAWSHQWLDLAPFAAQTITVTFAFRPASPHRLLLDEVAVGDADTVSLNKVYLPLVIR